MAEVKKMADAPSSKPPNSSKPLKQPLSPAAQRALAEAEARRQAAAAVPQQPVERDGRGGLDPVRYGDWEVKGIASDF
jgi:hypothetical protein